jgi:hypothetical protein
MGTNDTFNRLAERYVAQWNEPDPEVRHKLVEELWAEQGTYYNRFFVVQGRDTIQYAVTNGYQEYISKGFVFRSCHDAYGHHNGVTFGWVMVNAATGEVDTFGQEYIVLDEDGRILMDFQFQMKRPSA